jgi:uroporphyrinogen decarboxylase
MNNLTSYDRVKAALEHKESDRVPFDLGSAAVTGINVHALHSLRKYLGLPEKVTVKDKITQIGNIEEDLIETLKIDVKGVNPNPSAIKGLAEEPGVENGYDRIVDEWGMGWRMPLIGGHYYDLYKSPLAFAQSVADIEKYPWPDALDIARYSDLKEKADQIVYNEKKAYFLERMSSGMWEHAMWMRGYEQFYIDMMMNQGIVQAIMEKILEINMQYWERALESVGENVLVVSMADDLGSQNSLLVDLNMYKEQIWPFHKRLFEFVKSKAKSKIYIFFHNDGAVMETFPLLIEAGVDIMNPFQVNCSGMDTKKFKREFGRDMTIWGGSCDNQIIMPFGTPRQVKDETKRRIEDLSPGGGFIFAPIHVIQNGVPPENIMAWWETLQEYGRY